MTPLYQDPWYTFRFEDDRIIPRFHLEGVPAGRRVSVFKINPQTGERLGLLATALVGDGGWVDRLSCEQVKRSSPYRNRLSNRTSTDERLRGR
jgi:hypothetical protein